MGCASSAALPFLTVKENRAVVDPANMNGKTSHDLEMVTNKLGSRGLDSISDMNESFVSEKMKEVVDSSTVQGVIGSVVQVKDDVCNQVKGVGDAITGKVTSVINGVEETIESTFDKITGSVGAAEEKVKSEMKALEGGVKSMFDGSNEDKMTDSIKPEDIDELLSALPEGEEEAMEAAKAAAEEAVEKAVEEVAEEEANN